MTAPMNDDQAGRAVALAEYFVMLRDDLVRVGIIAGNTPPMFMTEAVCDAIKREVAAERERIADLWAGCVTEAEGHGPVDIGANRRTTRPAFTCTTTFSIAQATAEKRTCICNSTEYGQTWRRSTRAPPSPWPCRVRWRGRLDCYPPHGPPSPHPRVSDRGQALPAYAGLRADRCVPEMRQ